ncbi:flagellar FlbD family protein [Paeniglutamicibacter psychrophenolicus]|uniref:Flagellar protein FlbD n=1 Tax=Paeniglutamicibacter psychrophenolicus TaxID=257454 RepID=A0ABS4WCZ2_9MICC|nr:flagellar FlbD family protein [Paeniglutamicibacter psychrophenolicus]MBP2374068.1 flagellar protein FlbD [Paeniglutamicibacter psychrophenolicus]
MIVVTRLNATRFAINADLIERIQENPDTVVVMVNGAKYVVRETMEEVISLVAGHRARVVSLARQSVPSDPPLPHR